MVLMLSILGFMVTSIAKQIQSNEIFIVTFPPSWCNGGVQVYDAYLKVFSDLKEAMAASFRNHHNSLVIILTSYSVNGSVWWYIQLLCLTCSNIHYKKMVIWEI